jgi:lipid II:glycine glycyltransferase (peptidoglycan interpeptide bridge formation enzyme)
MEEKLGASGFRAVQDCRRYPKTIAINLLPDEKEILSSFHSTARRHIRAVSKNPVEVRPIIDQAYISRMRDLYRETMSRTGGGMRLHDWGACIEFSRKYPESSRLVGLFHKDAEAPEALLAFAWGCSHGNCAHYDAAASTRNTELRMPLAYGLVWDLIVWAKNNGATWFDFGGVTEGSFGSSDRLGGISDFKRYFSSTVLHIGGEWVYEPRWIRSQAARAISAGAAWLSGLRMSRRNCIQVSTPEAVHSA